MIGPVRRYPVNEAGTVLSPVQFLEGLYVDRVNGGTSLWKATFDYPHHLMQLKGRSESTMTWKGCFSLDYFNEWVELKDRSAEIWYVEIVIGSTCFVTTTNCWLRCGWTDETPNGTRRLLAKKFWSAVDYS